MEEEGGGRRLSKRFNDNNNKGGGGGGGEVDYKTTSGTAWSHSYLNQKPWHPLSYPNQRRKWIAEQTHAQRQRRSDEISREYAQEQDFLRQTSLLSHKEKEKVDMMQAVSFMYVRPPGYNAESAKAAEINDARKTSSSSVQQQAALPKEEKSKSRPKDVFGRALPTEDEFAVLKNAPRLETGVVGRAKPFAVEVRNVKCVRCGTYGHQSGDRECPLKDAIMPNDESRLKRDDPLTAIMAQMDPSEPLKWELKQKPGISPPRGGFQLDDPNQQIVAEDIFDEYGGFLSGGVIPDLLTNLSSAKHKKKSKSKRNSKNKKGHDESSSTSHSDNDERSLKMKSKSKSKRKLASHKRSHEQNSSASDGDTDGKILKVKSRHKHKQEAHQNSYKDSDSSDDSYENRRRSKKYARDKKRNKKDASYSSMSESDSEKYHGKSNRKGSDHQYRKSRDFHEDRFSDGERKYRRKGETYRSKKTCQNYSEYSSSETSESEKYTRKHKRSYS